MYGSSRQKTKDMSIEIPCPAQPSVTVISEPIWDGKNSRKQKGGESKGWKLTQDGRLYKRGRTVYPNKDVYEGDFVDGQRHGKGTMRFSNGNKYIGEFVDGMISGFGMYFWNTSNSDEATEGGEEKLGEKRYEGHFKHGKKHGKGYFIMGNGDIYTGLFERDRFHGEGILTTGRGDKYEGNWENNRLSGKNCKVTYANGDRYEGSMRSGYFHGFGDFHWRKKQGYYSGEWRKGKPHGRGTRLFINGSKYSGSFRNGEMTGDGVMSYANGDVYMGEWFRGYMHGKGVIKYRNGEQYEGSFYHGYFYGEGKYTWNDGGWYEGQYLPKKSKHSRGGDHPNPNGKRHGLGVRCWASGNRYEGSFADDEIHGTGVLQKLSGGKYRGKFWKGQRHGDGVEEFGNMQGEEYICPMGNRHVGEGFCIYSGSFVNNYFDGEGEFMCQDGRCYRGCWKKGKRHGQGTQMYLREGEAGDPERLWIGGVGSLYRIGQYTGEWWEDHKHGSGKCTYVNGDSIEGTFRMGRAEGLIKYTFASGKVRQAMYQAGRRVSWAKESAIKLSRTLTWLNNQGRYSRDIKNAEA